MGVHRIVLHAQFVLCELLNGRFQIMSAITREGTYEQEAPIPEPYGERMGALFPRPRSLWQ